jgi:hypothetical protein
MVAMGLAPWWLRVHWRLRVQAVRLMDEAADHFGAAGQIGGAAAQLVEGRGGLLIEAHLQSEIVSHGLIVHRLPM